LTLCDSDEDVFAIEGTAGKRVVADVSFVHADGDIDLMLRGIDGQQVLAVSDTVENSEHIEAVLPVDGVYFLRVFSLSENVKARYVLDVSLESP
jgi:transketolase C-terminal domain/subunit